MYPGMLYKEHFVMKFYTTTHSLNSLGGCHSFSELADFLHPVTVGSQKNTKLRGVLADGHTSGFDLGA